jgi:hypothetical protein
VKLGTVLLVAVVLVLFASQGCTRPVYYAVLAPHASMADRDGCFRQCRMLHAGQTKQFLSCVETCPGSRIVKEKRCNEVSYDTDNYGCTTAQNQTFDGVGTGIAIGALALLNVLAFVAVLGAGSSNTQFQPLTTGGP